MNRFLTTTAIASLLAVPAMADDTDIDQTVSALQTALNSILINFDGDSVTQAATNAANLISYDTDDLDDVNQTAGPLTQIGINSLITTGGPSGEFTNVDQDATNVANSIEALELEDLTQSVNGALQSGTNDIQAATGVSNFDQDAINAANLANIDGSEENVTQTFYFSAQDATNTIDTGGDIAAGAQDATNVVNSLTTANDVGGDLYQDVWIASQTAINDLDATGDVSNFAQSAVNAANLADVDGIDGNVLQWFDSPTQDASNNAFAFFGDVTEGSQAATNVANSLTFGGDVGGDLAQWNDGGVQTATNSMDGVANVANVSQAAVNAANIASIQSVGGNIDQNMGVVDGAAQTATNDILLVSGAASELSQDATNVGNSLSGAGGGLEIETAQQDVIDTDQIATNSIAGSPIGNPDQDVSVTSASNLAQTAVNAANLADLQDINVNLTQTFSDSGQLAVNSIDDVDPASGGISELAQAATNVANSATLDDVEASASLVQNAEMDAFDLEGQAALNFIGFGIDGVTNVSQAATNAVNLATLDELRGTLEQTVTNGAQVAGNLVNYSGFIGDGILGLDSAGLVSGLDQSAVNAANLVTVDSLPDISGTIEVTQSYSGFQVAGNGLYDADNIMNVTQAATNVANSISNP